MGCIYIGLLLSILSFTRASECPTDGPVRACYYASWAYYREKEGHYNISHIDPMLCTHMVYTFAGLDVDSKITSLDPNYDINKGAFQYFNSLKTLNPCLKTLLAIGGWNEGSMKYSIMASTKYSRFVFIESVLRYLATYNFDGIDIDWEYPTSRGGIEEDKENLVLLIRELKERLEKWNLMITIAVPISEEITMAGYDIAGLKDLVDYVFVMAYDYTATNSKHTGLIAPLSKIKRTLAIWREHMPEKKIVLGLPSYARTFTLLDAKNTSIGAPTNGTGPPGRYTKEAGFLSFYELKSKLATTRYKVNASDTNYYAYYKNEWLSFDLEDSYKNKTKYALEQNLGGVMLWSIDTDDFLGIYNKNYTILNTIKDTIEEFQANNAIKL